LESETKLHKGTQKIASNTRIQIKGLNLQVKGLESEVEKLKSYDVSLEKDAHVAKRK